MLFFPFFTPCLNQIVHAVAEQLHLIHWSEGEEGCRRVVLQKQNTEGLVIQQPLIHLPASAPSPPPPRLLPSVSRYMPPAMRRQQMATKSPQ